MIMKLFTPHVCERLGIPKYLQINVIIKRPLSPGFTLTNGSSSEQGIPLHVIISICRDRSATEWMFMLLIKLIRGRVPIVVVAESLVPSVIAELKIEPDAAPCGSDDDFKAAALLPELGQWTQCTFPVHCRFRLRGGGR